MNEGRREYRLVSFLSFRSFVLVLLPLAHLIFFVFSLHFGWKPTALGHIHWIILTTLVVAESFLIAGSISSGSYSVRILFAGMLAMSEIVILLQVASLFNLLREDALIFFIDSFLILQGVVLSFFLQSHPQQTEEMEYSHKEILALVALVIVIRVLLSIDPPLYYDALTYHLSFAVEWMQRGNLDTPFQAYGDLAPAFYPVNGSLLYLWNMVFVQTDFWARWTQVPFLVLIAASALVISRNLGGRFQGGIFAIFLLCTVQMLRLADQDQGNDLITAALLFTGVAFLTELIQWENSASAFGFLMAICLALGTKYLSVLYTPVLVVSSLFMARRFWFKTGIRSAAKWIALFLLLFLGVASFAYMRNAFVTGSMIFPASVDHIPGLHSAIAVPDLSANPFRERCRNYSELNITFGRSWIVIVIGSLSFLLWRNGYRKSLALWLVAMAFVIVAAFYLITPYKHCRFLLLPLLMMVPIMSVSLEQAIFTNASFSSVQQMMKKSRKFIIAGLFMLSVVPFLQIGTYEKEKYDRWAAARKLFFGRGWRYVQEETRRFDRPLRIILSRTQNAPYPLYGLNLSNKVSYVPSTRSPEDVYYGWQKRILFPFGHLKERRWLAFLEEIRPDYFFSTTYVTLTGFGMEDTWAQNNPARFHLVYRDRYVRIYKVSWDES
jgi:hypothetical protein